MPLSDIVQEARRLLDAASEASVPVRLTGGLAVHHQIGEGLHPALRRPYKDIDIVIQRRWTREAERFLEGLGYVADRQFNAVNRARRLLFLDDANARQLDVFVDRFEMCHSIPLTDRFDADPFTVPLAELLLTKLQIVELNEKDRRDIIALLFHRPIGQQDGGQINGDVVARLLARDWGLWRTTRMTLERVESGLSEYDLAAAERAVVSQRVAELWHRIEDEPKGRAWRMRDRIGDRRRWYDEPDEVR